jgi:glucose-1-phosphate adenylyltransferase
VTKRSAERDTRRIEQQSVALILAGGRGSRLHYLTDNRAKPAVYFGGKYRIVDFVLSNCVNSGIRRIYVATQYKSHSLLRHIQRGWGILRGELNEFIDLLPAQQRIDESTWYRGTADAVFQNLDILTAEAPAYVVVLAGDHIYRQDYRIMLQQHVECGADVTVGCVEVPRSEASAFGVMDVDASGRVVGFLEKPDAPPGLPDHPDRTLASMGIYVFSAEAMYDELRRDAGVADSTHDFGRDFIPYLVKNAKVMAHRLQDSAIYGEHEAEPYWRDVGTIDAYWSANMDLCAVTPDLDLYDLDWPVWTYQPQLPPAKFVFDQDGRRGMAVDSVVSDGCVVSGSRVRRSVLSSQARINSYARVDGAVILPHVVVGRHARLTNVVVDHACHVPEGLVAGEDAEEDARRFYRTDAGTTVITQQMLDALERRR